MPTMPTKEGGGAVLTIHQSRDRGAGGEDMDGQSELRIGPSWVLHPEGGIHVPNKCLQNMQEFNIVIL
jgi:hypothetical protein